MRRRLLKSGCILLAAALCFGAALGIGEAKELILNGARPAESAHREVDQQPALSGKYLKTDRGELDLSRKKALFFAPGAGCTEALRKAGELPAEKRPYLVVFAGGDEEAQRELEKCGLSGMICFRCRGEPPTDTVPSLVWVESGRLKRYTCSAAVDALEKEKYPILLARAELPFVPGPADSNAARALMSLSGAVVSPGEEFSFYRHIGVPSEERGYLPARSLVETPDGPVWVEDVGGGICKAATLLNFAVERVPGLEVVEVHRHTRPVSFAPEGKDVAVARSSGWDYRFRNGRERPVQIKAHWDDKVLKIEIWELASR